MLTFAVHPNRHVLQWSADVGEREKRELGNFACLHSTLVSGFELKRNLPLQFGFIHFRIKTQGATEKSVLW